MPEGKSTYQYDACACVVMIRRGYQKLIIGGTTKPEGESAFTTVADRLPLYTIGVDRQVEVLVGSGRSGKLGHVAAGRAAEVDGPAQLGHVAAGRAAEVDDSVQLGHVEAVGCTTTPGGWSAFATVVDRLPLYSMDLGRQVEVLVGS